MRISDWSSDVCSSDLFIDKDGLGSIFKEWRQALIDCGYEVEFKILNAADYGVGTKRKRLFVVARRDGLPIRFPKPQYGPRKSPEVLAGKLLPYSPIADFIDFSKIGRASCRERVCQYV